MKGSVLRFAAFMALAIVPVSAHAADLIGYWNFNTGASSTANAAWPGPTIPRDQGQAGALISMTGWGPGTEDFAGTSINVFPGDPAGVSLSLLAGGSGNPNNGDHIEFQFSMTGLSGLELSYATQKTSTGFNSNQWSYSTDGINFTPFGDPVDPATSFALVTRSTSALDGAANAYLRYTLNGASGTAGTGNNRLDNIRLNTPGFVPPFPPPANPGVEPQPGDVVLGMNVGDTYTTLELVRGQPNDSGTKQNSMWYQDPFIQSVEFDNHNGQTHNPGGNLLGVNFGTSTTSGTITSFATRDADGFAPAGQVIGSTATGHSSHSGLTQTRLAGLSVSPDNSKVAVTGYDQGSVIVYDYTAGNTMGSGAALTGGRATSTILTENKTQGTAWYDNTRVLAFSREGDLIRVDATNSTTMASPEYLQTSLTMPATLYTTEFLDIEYNEEVSDRYVYAMFSGFTNATTLDTRLFVFDSQNNFLPVVDGGLSIQSAIGADSSREIALDADGNLFFSAFGGKVYVMEDVVTNPAALTASASLWYDSTTNAGFSGMDIGHGEVAATPGDINGDGTVDILDYVVGRMSDGPGTGPELGEWAENYGNDYNGSGSAAGAAVPEPATVGLLALGLVAACCGRRRTA